MTKQPTYRMYATRNSGVAPKEKMTIRYTPKTIEIFRAKVPAIDRSDFAERALLALLKAEGLIDE